MSSPTHNFPTHVSNPFNDKTVSTKQIRPRITEEQKKIVRIFESSLCSSSELPIPRRSSLTSENTFVTKLDDPDSQREGK